MGKKKTKKEGPWRVLAVLTGEEEQEREMFRLYRKIDPGKPDSPDNRNYSGGQIASLEVAMETRDILNEIFLRK